MEQLAILKFRVAEVCERRQPKGATFFTRVRRGEKKVALVLFLLLQLTENELWKGAGGMKNGP